MSQIPSPYDPTHGHHHQEHMHSEHCGLCRIELEHVSVSAGGDTLLSDVNMHIHCGQLTALVGPNGAGKTTLVRALLSQIPHTGQIRHMDNQERPLRSVRTGYVPQQLPFDKKMPVTVTDFLAASLTRRPVWTGVGKKTRAQVLEALALARAEKLASRQLGQLSGGELQRVLLAMALTIPLAIYHYACHYLGSRSIYLMRRLPDGWELWRRCLTVPALLAVLCLGAIELLTILYFLVFLLLTPPPCLPAEPWRQLLCALGGGRI